MTGEIVATLKGRTVDLWSAMDRGGTLPRSGRAGKASPTLRINKIVNGENMAGASSYTRCKGARVEEMRERLVDLVQT